jgi:hypothetical protein
MVVAISQHDDEELCTKKKMSFNLPHVLVWMLTRSPFTLLHVLVWM